MKQDSQRRRNIDSTTMTKLYFVTLDEWVSVQTLISMGKR